MAQIPQIIEESEHYSYYQTKDYELSIALTILTETCLVFSKYIKQRFDLIKEVKKDFHL